MEKLKDIVLIGFAIVGFISILSGFTEQQVYGTPESHIWSFHINDAGENFTNAFALNKQTGEVRRYTTRYSTLFDDKGKKILMYDKYLVTKPLD